MSERWLGRAGRLNLSAWALRHRALTLYAMLAILAAGAWAYMALGRAEDPPFTIKQMIVQVDWPGASADEMAREVTDRIERKLEELPSLDYTESATQPGRAIITISLRDDTPPTNVLNRLAAARRDMPPSTAALSRDRGSSDRGRATPAGPLASRHGEAECARVGEPLSVHRGRISL
jgi:multidrug efflux pump subunit AcrB